jgi:molybdopterin-guanine dinucleotide biosynthesis protein A
MAVAVSGAVLAGGKGVRLGTDKAMLRVGGKTLLARVTGQLTRVVDEVLIVGRGDLGPVPDARTVPDARPGAGALGGVYTALLEAQAPRCLVVACDMPFLNSRLLSYLIDLAAGYDVVIPRLGEWFEPLHAVYAKTCLDPIERLLAEGELRILEFLDRVNVRYVDRPELNVFDPGLRSIFNINTPEQLEQALVILRETEGRPA